MLKVGDGWVVKCERLVVVNRDIHLAVKQSTCTSLRNMCLFSCLFWFGASWNETACGGVCILDTHT